jgi:hypothetical protein
MTVYVNGIPDGSSNKTGSIREDTWPLHLGRSYYTDTFPGVIDDVHVYKRDLPPAEIQTHYQAGVGAMPDDWRGYWTFDESTGSVADDVSGYLNNGNINGASFVQDGVGISLGFTGTANVEVPDDASLDITNQITIELWAKKYTNVVGWNDMVLKWGSYFLEITENQKLGGCIWGKSVQGNTYLYNNNWYHLVATYDGYYTRLYVNGVPDGNPVYNLGVIPADNWPLHIGHSYYQNAFPGYLDEVRVYPYVLSPERILYHYTNEKPPQYYDAHSAQQIGLIHNGYTSSSLGYYGNLWNPITGRYLYHFKMVGTGATTWKSNGKDVDRLTYASIDTNVTQGQGVVTLLTGETAAYIGSIPESEGPTPDYSWARAVVSYAVLAIRLFPVSFAWTTSQVVFDMISNYDGAINSATEKKRTWDYGWESDAAQYFYFIVDSPPLTQFKFTAEYKMRYIDFYGSNPWLREVTIGPYEYTYNVPAGLGGAKGSNGESWNPGMMTDEEKEKYGIVEIPIDWFLKEGGCGLYFPPEDLQKMLELGESVVYYSYNLPVEVKLLESESNDSVPTVGTITVPVPTAVPTIGTGMEPTPTPVRTQEPAKEQDQTPMPTVTPTPTRVPSSGYNN